MRKKVLIVDDEKSLTAMAAGALHNSYDVILAGSAEEALGLHFSRRPDLVIADILLKEGGMSGIDLIVEIRKKDSIPIIAITGGDGAYLESAERMGAFRVLRKPFSKEALVEAVDKAFRDLAQVSKSQ